MYHRGGWGVGTKPISTLWAFWFVFLLWELAGAHEFGPDPRGPAHGDGIANFFLALPFPWVGGPSNFNFKKGSNLMGNFVCLLWVPTTGFKGCRFADWAQIDWSAISQYSQSNLSTYSSNVGLKVMGKLFLFVFLFFIVFFGQPPQFCYVIYVWPSRIFSS